MNPLKIFLADDHGMIRAGLKSLIDTDSTLKIVGEASDGEEVLARVPLLAPDILVLDISMPKLGGAQVAKQLKTLCPDLKIIVLTVHEDRAYLRELLEAGASGYALKRAASSELLRAIHLVAEGRPYVDPSLTGELIRLIGPPPGDGSRAELSEREDEVLRLVAEGYSSKEISATLNVSVKTIETYKARSMEKLGLKSRVDLIRYAKEAGWFRA